MTKHIRPLTKKPAYAQFEMMLNLVGLISSLLGLVEQAEDVLGVDLTKKDNEEV